MNKKLSLGMSRENKNIMSNSNLTPILLSFGIFFLIVIFNSSNISALEFCPDTNLIDISQIPCIGVTNVLSCSGNISVINLNTSEQTNVTTFPIGNSRYNFTFNFNQSTYSLVDCEQSSATVIVGLFEEGYGTSLFFFILPSILISYFALFLSSKLGRKLIDDEKEASMLGNTMYKSQWIPTVIVLFSFVPMIFMIRIVQGYLEKYVTTSGLVNIFNTFYIFFSYLFYFVFLISFIVLMSEFIKKRRIRLGLADED